MVSKFTFDVLVNFPFENEGITKCIMIKCWVGDLEKKKMLDATHVFLFLVVWNNSDYKVLLKLHSCVTLLRWMHIVNTMSRQ